MGTLYRWWKKECGRKKVWPDEESAAAEAVLLNNKNGDPDDPVLPYSCPWPPLDAPHWHTGHTSKPVPRALLPIDRIDHRLDLIARHERPTAWQAAYVEDVRFLLELLEHTRANV